MKKLVYLTLVTITLFNLHGCRNRNSHDSAEILGDTLTSCARLLTLIDCGNYTVAEVKNPWDTTGLLNRYILIDKDNPDGLTFPDGMIIKVPLKNSIVYSDVHGSAIGEIGATDAISGVADATYFKTPEIVDGLKSGKITDIGQATAPTLEKIISINPDAILASPYQNAGHGLIGQTGIPVIECADYMETTPLGRAEWIKLLGLLYGNRDHADKIFNDTKARYDSLRFIALAISTLPTVVTEQLTDGIWYVPGGKSYMARILGDAAVRYPWSDDDSSGSLQLDFSTVFDHAHNADFWLIRTWGHDLTLDELKSNYALNASMDAFKKGHVYAANTAEVPLFEDLPFHPDRLLHEYLAIFHPYMLKGDTTLLYYKKVH